MSEVMLGYSASSNVTFRGKISTGIEREEWNAMTDKERDDVMNGTLWELVQLYVIEESE